MMIGFISGCKKYMSMYIMLEAEKAADISCKGKQKAWSNRISQMSQFEINGL